MYKKTEECKQDRRQKVSFNVNKLPGEYTIIKVLNLDVLIRLGNGDFRPF